MQQVDYKQEQWYRDMVEMYGTGECPYCGICLDNGVCSRHDDVNGKPVKFDTMHEFSCLACGHEFGPEEKPSVKTGRKHPKNMTLRAQLFDRFDAGDSVKKCQIEFGITYGNAHYHYRNWKKEQK